MAQPISNDSPQAGEPEGLPYISTRHGVPDPLEMMNAISSGQDVHPRAAQVEGAAQPLAEARPPPQPLHPPPRESRWQDAEAARDYWDHFIGDDDTMPPLENICPVSSGASILTTMSGLTSRFSEVSIHGSARAYATAGMDSPLTCRSVSSSRCMGRGALHRALAKGAPLQEVELLLQAGKDRPKGKEITRSKDTDGMTPLHLAMKRKAPDMEAALAVLHADQEVAKLRDDSGRTPLHWAMKAGVHQDLVQALLRSYPEAATTADAQGRLPLHCIEEETPLQSVELLYNHHPVAAQAQDVELVTPLHKLCRRVVNKGGVQSHDDTHLLVDMSTNLQMGYTSGVDPKRKDAKGESPLSILLEGCSFKTNQLKMDIDMQMDLVAHWSRLCAPLEKEHLDMLTKMSMTFRELNEVVEGIVSDAQMQQNRACQRPECVRLTKRNRSADTQKSHPTTKQIRFGPTASHASTDVTSYRSKVSKGTNCSTAQTTAPSASNPASSTVQTDSCSNSLRPSASITCSTSPVNRSGRNPSPVASPMAQLTNAEPANKSNSNENDDHIKTTDGVLHNDTTLVRIETPPPFAMHYLCFPDADDLGVAEDSSQYSSKLLGSLAGSFSSNTVKAGTGNSPCKAPSSTPTEITPTQKAKEAPNKDADSSMNRAEVAVRRYQTAIAGEPKIEPKVALIVEMYCKEAKNIALVQMEGPKRYMKRIYPIARCIRACFQGDKKAFLEENKSLDVARYKCPKGEKHWRSKAVDDSVKTEDYQPVAPILS